MAKQKGIIKLEGTIGDITFYKSQDGFLAKGKGGILINTFPILYLRLFYEFPVRINQLNSNSFFTDQAT
jgi:hypothetical protein